MDNKCNHLCSYKSEAERDLALSGVKVWEEKKDM